MRPVQRGPEPVEAPFGAYGEALKPLTDRLGRYCSYCERPVLVSLAVEHVQPKSLEEDLELEWTNFLLGCTNCNSTKSDKPVAIADFLWPDLDNTALAFRYEGGVISANDDLSAELQDKAARSLALTGLDRHPGAATPPTDKDRRWFDRLQATARARHYREQLQTNPDPALRAAVVDIAVLSGSWSIWYAEFEGDDAMRRALIEGYPGTAADCFDENQGFDCVARPGGQL